MKDKQKGDKIGGEGDFHKGDDEENFVVEHICQTEQWPVIGTEDKTSRFNRRR